MPRNPCNTDYAVGHSPADARSAVQRSETMHPHIRHIVLEQALLVCFHTGLTKGQAAKLLSRSRFAVWLRWERARFSAETGVGSRPLPRRLGPGHDGRDRESMGVERIALQLT